MKCRDVGNTIQLNSVADSQKFHICPKPKFKYLIHHFSVKILESAERHCFFFLHPETRTHCH